MCKKLNWKKNWNLNYFNTSAKVIVLLIGLTVFAIQANAQVNNLKLKNKDINGDPNPYMKIGGVGIWPCAERFSISLEDTSKFIFSSASAFCATLLVPNDTLIDFPNDGVGANGKRNINEQMTYQKAFERIKHLKPGYQNSVMGEKWDLAAEQMQELYPNQVYEVNYNNQARTAFNYNNIFFEMLMSIQVLAKENEELQNTIEQQATTIERLNERMENIESFLNIEAEIIPNKTFGEVNIDPNPITNGNLQVSYQLNEYASKAALIITDIQGKQVYENLLTGNQKTGNQNLNIDLPAGTYLYYLKSETEKTNAQKLIIL